MIDICLLGCGGSMPMIERFLSSAIISYKGRKILIDCGEGTQVALRNVRAGFKNIDVICITHCHGDHIIGLPGLLSTIGNSGRIDPLVIIGPKGIEDVVNGLRVIAKYLPYDVIIVENKKEIYLDFKDNKLLLGCERKNIKIDTIDLEHSIDCIGYKFYIKRERRFSPEQAEKNNVPKVLWNKLQMCEENNITFDNGKEYTKDMVLGKERRGIQISYITDTRPINKIVDFVMDSDFLICEGTYGDNDDINKAIKNKHMTFNEAAKLAYNSKSKELLLTHFSPAMDNPSLYEDNAKQVFNNTIVGYDGFKKTLIFSQESEE